MVTGFESFRAHFQGYEDCYTIIGYWRDGM